MRFLIAGGFGFLGARIGDYLSKAGHQIVLGTRHKVNPPDWLIDAEVVQINWNDVNTLQEVCKGVDVVIHAAGMNAKDCAEDPVAALAFNGVATSKLVESANRSGVKKFIYLSTAHVYASPLVGNITEETNLTNSHPYATSHVAGEQALLSSSNNGGMQGVVLRLSNAFGKPMDSSANCWMLIVNDLCRQVIETGEMHLQSDGTQKRDFIGIGEVCRLVDNISLSQKNPSLTGVLNIGSGMSRSIIEMAQFIQARCYDIFGFNPPISVPNSSNVNKNSELNYQSIRLEKIGGNSPSISNQIEIDGLLRYCKSMFQGK